VPIPEVSTRREKIDTQLTNHTKKSKTMDAEHINTINARLADLSQRVVELRRYL
jgi:hypothetical protein